MSAQNRAAEVASKRAGRYADCIKDALSYERSKWGTGEEINAPDLLDWFAEWRERADLLLKQNGDGPRTRQLGLAVKD
jgi:hypothetical protein